MQENKESDESINQENKHKMEIEEESTNIQDINFTLKNENSTCNSKNEVIFKQFCYFITFF